jgi:N-acetylglucosamine kinase-like BadF-type ATPase
MRNLGKRYVLGVDGGGTKTAACIAELEPGLTFPRVGKILGRGFAGPGNPLSVGFSAACDNICTAIDHATAHAKLNSGLDALTIHSACICLAGAGRLEEQQRMRDAMIERGIAQAVSVSGDIEPIQWAAEFEAQEAANIQNQGPLFGHETTPGDAWERCITLIAGTGSIARGVQPNANPVRAGGWGYLLGDEGSGFDIGLIALQDLCLATDQGRPLTPLHSALLQGLSVEKASDLVGVVYQSDKPQLTIASVANVVLGFMDSDPLAKSIGNRVARAWAELVECVHLQLGILDKPFTLAIAGGIAVNKPILVEQLMTILEEKSMKPSLYRVVQHPVHGALTMAARNLSP